MSELESPTCETCPVKLAKQLSESVADTSQQLVDSTIPLTERRKIARSLSAALGQIGEIQTDDLRSLINTILSPRDTKYLLREMHDDAIASWQYIGVHISSSSPFSFGGELHQIRLGVHPTRIATPGDLTTGERLDTELLGKLYDSFDQLEDALQEQVQCELSRGEVSEWGTTAYRKLNKKFEFVRKPATLVEAWLGARTARRYLEHLLGGLDYFEPGHEA